MTLSNNKTAQDTPTLNMQSASSEFNDIQLFSGVKHCCICTGFDFSSNPAVGNVTAMKHTKTL